MAKRISTSQLKSKLRQAERKIRKDVNDYNRAVNKYNSQLKRAVDAYNRFVREYNSSVRKNKQIISREIRKLNTSSHSTYYTSVQTMQQHYLDVSSLYAEGWPVSSEQDEILNLIESEQANSIITANAIENNEYPDENTEDQEIGDKLHLVSVDLDNRWKGAVFALNPNNPDAARHFCTSAREIFTEFIEMKAPDDAVFRFNPSCARTDRGNATRKEKIRYMMRDKQMESCVIDFADEDINNILELFHVLSDGTHGAAGRYEFDKLLQVKKRVEQGINFLCTISK